VTRATRADATSRACLGLQNRDPPGRPSDPGTPGPLRLRTVGSWDQQQRLAHRRRPDAALLPGDACVSSPGQGYLTAVQASRKSRRSR